MYVALSKKGASSFKKYRKTLSKRIAWPSQAKIWGGTSLWEGRTCQPKLCSQQPGRSAGGLIRLNSDTMKNRMISLIPTKVEIFAFHKGKACNLMWSLLRRRSLEVSSAGSLFQGWGAEASRADTEYFYSILFVFHIHGRNKYEEKIAVVMSTMGD